MPRHRRESDLVAFIDLASRLPWWLGIILAAFSYLVLHPIAEAPVLPPTEPREMGEAMTNRSSGSGRCSDSISCRPFS